MYNALLERWQEERDTPTLLPLRDSFLQNLREYIEQILDQLRSEELSPLQRQLFEVEIANLRFMMENLLRMRVQKILNQLTDSEINYDLLTRQERRFVDQITRNFRSAMMPVEDLFSPIDAEASSRLLLVRFLEDHPQLVGVDLRTYGPFKADDLATLPIENARVIIRRNLAEPVNSGAIHNESSKSH